jgi:hypothetical protein
MPTTEVEIIPQAPKKAMKAPRTNQTIDLGTAKVQVHATAECIESLRRRMGKASKQKVHLASLPKKSRYTAKNADHHELYQLSVQSPDEDVLFLRRVYKSLRKKKAMHFREDFCGTALLSTTWVNTMDGATAEGYDIDCSPLAWGLVNNLGDAGEVAENVTLVVADVREPSITPPDIRCAQNFSYCCFKEREELVGYFKAVLEDLATDGVFVLDIHGGSETQSEMEEEREIPDGFTYVWDQDRYWPITGDALNYIHFRFEDGTELYRAFTYDWRLWGLPELRDCLIEAGFASVQTYWEGTADDGESGNGIFKVAKRGEADLSWIAYLAATK